MDFLEGFFLGKEWTDSDYANHRHKTFFIVMACCLCAATLIYFLAPQKLTKFLRFSPQVFLFIGLLLLIGLPFASAYYHRVRWPIKLLILAGYGVQYFCLLAAFVQISVTFINLDLAVLPLQIMEFGNQLITKVSGFFAFLGSLGGMLAGIIVGAILMGLIVLFSLMILIIIPLAYILLFRQLQRGVSYLVGRKILKLPV